MIGCVSAIAIVSVAAVCAGYLCFEGYQIRRLAQVRARRRHEGAASPWLRATHATAGDVSSRKLERCLLVAVEAADVVWAYNERLFVRGPSGESPFQLRRGRVDRAQQRYVQACDAVTNSARAWLADRDEANKANDAEADPRIVWAVQRMAEELEASAIPQHWHAYDPGHLESTIDLAENALFNLRRGEHDGAQPHPFR